MKKLQIICPIVAFVLVSLSAIGLWAQFGEQPYTWWTKTYGGQADDESREAQPTSDGGFIFGGWTNSFGAGGYDVYLVKTDASGNTVWTKTYGGTGDDMGYSVQQTSDGGFIIAGWTNSFGAGGKDVYLVKTDASGVPLWEKMYGGGNDDIATSVKQTSDRGFIIAGQTKWAIAWDDIYLIKTDAAGTATWTQIWDISYNDDRIDEVQQTTDGGYILAGHSYYTGSGNVLDFTLIKTDPNGNRLWTKTYGKLTDQRAFSVQQTSDGGYILSGYTADYTSMPQIFPNVWLVKTDANGIKMWDKTFGGPNEEFGWSVRQIYDGGYIIAGRTNSFGADGYDVLLIRTDGLGNDLWTTTYGGTGNDEAYSVEQTSPGKYIISGYTYSYGAGGKDAWLISVMGALALDVDIKPGSDPNSINCTNENALIPVAILTTSDFDATTVDHASVTFEGASETHVKKKTGELQRHEEDVDSDGDLDLVFHFRLADTQLTCSSTKATLTGETFSGQQIVGNDLVNMIHGLDKSVSEELVIESIPAAFALMPNYPNPVNLSTIIPYMLHNSQHVKLEVYDILGKKIATLVDISQEAGTYSVPFDATQLPSGVYLYKLQAGSYSEIKKMILMR